MPPPDKKAIQAAIDKHVKDANEAEERKRLFNSVAARDTRALELDKIFRSYVTKEVLHLLKIKEKEIKYFYTYSNSSSWDGYTETHFSIDADGLHHTGISHWFFKPSSIEVAREIVRHNGPSSARIKTWLEEEISALLSA